MQVATQPTTLTDTPKLSLVPFLLVAAAITAIGIVLRCYALGSQSLWFDEGYSAWIIGLPASEIVRIIRADVSPPLYYLLLKFWVQFAGNSEAGLRSLSTVAACLAVPLVGLTAWRMTIDRAATLVAMVVAAFSVLQIQFAQEARSYGLASFLALVAFYSVLRSAGGRPIWLIFASVASAASVYLHNMMWFYLAALNVAYLIMPGVRPLKKRLADICAIDAAVLAVYAWWIPALIGQMRWLHGNFWAPVPDARDLAQVLVAASGMKLMHLSAILRQWAALFAGVVLFLICAIPLVARSRANFRWALAVLVYGLLPILAVFAHAHIGQSFFLEKVFTASAFSIPLLAGLACVAPLRLQAAPAILALLAGSAISDFGYFQWEQKEDWRGASTYVNRVERKGTLVIFAANEGELLYRYYTQRADLPLQQLTGAPQSFLDLDPPKTIQRVQSDKDLAAFAGVLDALKPSRVVLVLAHTAFSDPKNLTRDMIASRMKRVSDQPFHLMMVEVYDKQGNQ